MVRKRVCEKSERLFGRSGLPERGQFPQSTPTRAGLLFEKDAAAFHDPRRVFAHVDDLCARAFDGNGFRVSCAAFFTQWTPQAVRFCRTANQRAEFHQSRCVDPSAAFRQ